MILLDNEVFFDVKAALIPGTIFLEVQSFLEGPHSHKIVLSLTWIEGRWGVPCYALLMACTVQDKTRWALCPWIGPDALEKFSVLIPPTQLFDRLSPALREDLAEKSKSLWAST